MIWDGINRSAWPRYTVSILLAIVASAIRWQLHGFLGFHNIFLTFYPAVTIAALYGGFGPGVLATAASAVLAAYMFEEPVGLLAIRSSAELISMAIFLSCSILISYLIDAAYSAQARAHKAEEQTKLVSERDKADLEKARLIRLRLHLIEYAVAHTMDELLRKALDEIGEIVESSIGFYHFVESDQKTVLFQQWSTRTLKEFCCAVGKGRHCSIDQAGVWVDCVREKKPVIHNDYSSLEEKKGVPEGHAEIIRELVVPVIRAGKVVAVLGVGNKEIEYSEKDAEIVAYLADVTWEIIEHKRDEEKIRQSEVTLRTVLNQLPSGVTVRDASTGALIFANVRGGQIAGTLAPDVSQFSIYRCFYPDGRQYRVEDLPFFRSMTRGELVDSEESEYERADGTRFFISMSSAPIRDLQGQIVMSVCVFHDITGRKRAEQRLRESEALLAESEKISHLGSWSLDLRTDRLIWSDEVYRIFGLEPQEFDATYKAFLEAVHPEDREAVDNAYSTSLEKHEGSYEIEHRIIRKHTGEVRQVQEKCVHQSDTAGNIVRSVGMVLDITERKMAEDALRQSQARLDLALRSAGMGTWHWDIPTNTLCFDEQGRFLLGLDQAAFSVTKHEVFAAVHPDDRETVRKALVRTVRQDVPFEMEHRAIQPDGRIVHIAARGKLARDCQGQPQRINGLVWDITDRKHAEEALSSKEATLRGILDAAEEAIFLFAPDGVVITANQTGLNRFGDSAEEVIGKHFSEFLPTELAQSRLVHVMDAVQRKQTVEFEDQRAGIFFHHTLYPVLDRAERLTSVVCFSRDITERKRMENELRRSRDELEFRVQERTADLESAYEKLRMVPSMLIEAQENERHRLAAELHDSIGQTIAALKFRIEHVISTLKEQEYARALNLLREFVPVLQRSIDETRAIYMGLKPMILAEYGILATLEWFRQELLKLYPNQHIELETAIGEEEIPDNLKIAIFRIVQEALNNYFKHGNGEWVDVRIALIQDMIELEISDDGVGMDLDYIMESSTAKSLGLIGMRERAERTGGKFTMNSTPGAGTTVRVCWPLKSQENIVLA